MERPRFQVGDLVHIADVASPYYAEEGHILAILVNKQVGAPNKYDLYDVLFSDGHSSTFWDAQLEMKLG